MNLQFRDSPVLLLRIDVITANVFKIEFVDVARTTCTLLFTSYIVVKIMASNPTNITAPERKSSIDEESVRRLERQLQQRPEKSELIDKNIMEDDKVAPALQAAKKKLERSRLEDKLGQALLQRPKPDELVRDGILTTDDAPVSA